MLINGDQGIIFMYKNRNENKKEQIREVKYGYQEVNAYVHSCPRLEEVEN